MKQLLSVAIAKQAVEIVKRVIPYSIAADVATCFKSQNIHVVIGNPTISRKNDSYSEWLTNGGILYEESIGPECTNRYVQIARNKCFLTWLHQMPTVQLQCECPHLLIDGDTIYYGSVWRGGLAVGASGQKAAVDQAIAGCVHEFCVALCMLEKQRIDDQASITTSFSGFMCLD